VTGLRSAALLALLCAVGCTGDPVTPTEPPDTTEPVDTTALDDDDGDGLTNAEEATRGTDPLRADSDRDGLDDGAEVHDVGTDPLDDDTDDDDVSDGDEVALGTDPLAPDTDGGGATDGREVSAGTDPTDGSDDDQILDDDGDGLTNADEVARGTLPDEPDTDRDGLDDGHEVQVSLTDPLTPDTDADGLLDGDEPGLGTDPLDPDTDGGRALDGAEVTAGTDPTDPDDDSTLLDDDGDGLTNAVEEVLGTDPDDPDTDADSLDDGDEIAAGTEPLLADTDGDGLLDGDEVALGIDPTDVDTDGGRAEDGAEVLAGTDPGDPADDDILLDDDGDGLTNREEAELGTDPLLTDTDGDGLTDDDEVARLTDPLAADTDGDGLSDGREVGQTATDPLAADSDGDTVDDGLEVDTYGSDPLVPGLAGIPPRTWTGATDCALPADPSASSATVGYEAAFVGAGLEQPMMLTHAHDDSGRLFVAERTGRLKVFPNQEPTPPATTFLDLSGVVELDEGGLVGVAFHPDHANNGRFYTSYHSRTIFGDGLFWAILSEWQVSPTNPDEADPNSERILLAVEQPTTIHHGGDVTFGPDGYLYLGLGDGGPQGDPYGVSQDPTNLLGSILRIDVDDPGTPDRPYGIPADNPFVSSPMLGLPEIWAWGFRNPWRMSFDPLTGDFWVGDIGHNRIEEVSLVTRGTNAGWVTMEGPECWPGPNTVCSSDGLKIPEIWYWHNTGGRPGAGRSVTGGYVYRGSAVPSLYGAYVYADYVYNYVWAHRHGVEPMPFPDDGSDALLVGPGDVASFGRDADGEIYMLKLFGGNPVWRFVETTPAPPVDFPQTLTDTGCFTDLTAMTPAGGVFEYGVNQPLWSDGAHKRRWFVLPDGETITYRSDGQWSFPEGTLFIKHFAIETVEGDPTSSVPLETRFTVQEAGGRIRGYTYRWNDAGTEATLIPAGDQRTLSITRAGGATEEVTWGFPSRGQCLSCHNSSVGGPIGTETAQLNRDFDYPGVWPQPLNTLDVLALYGLFDAPPADATAEPRLARLDDASAPLDDRARGYLHANCAMCHQPGAPSGLTLDLRSTTPLADTAACDVAPARGGLGLPDARRIASGDAARSVLLARMEGHVEGTRMPPLATTLVHDEAVQAVGQWIDGLSGCPAP